MTRPEQLIAEGLDPVQAHRVARQETALRAMAAQDLARRADECRAAYARMLAAEKPAA